MIKSAVRTVKLCKQYNGVYVLNNISIELPLNGIFGVLGRNGAGKTTLLAMLMGLITPSDGDIFIFEESLKIKKYEILKQLNFQSPYVELPKKMTVIQNLLFYAKMYDVKDSNLIISELASDLNIKKYLDKNYGTLSSGQKTRVNLCKALLNKPKLLLLDEPTASLDVSTSKLIREYILNFQKLNNSSIIITSHDLIEIEKMCNYLVILEKGNVFYKGSIKDLFKKNKCSSLEEIFLKNNDK